MPLVPGFSATPPPPRNEAELARLRKAKRQREQEAREKKRQQLHDNHWANNPAPTFEVPTRPRHRNPWRSQD